MKVLVVSDSHHDEKILNDLIERYRNEVDAMIHLGDSELSADDPIWKDFTVKIAGNCDFGLGFPSHALLQLGDQKIYCVHGHHSSLKYGLDQLTNEADEAGCTIVLFGHTHEAFCKEENNLLFVNPGSIVQPRGELLEPSYVLLDWDDQNYHIDFYNRSQRAIPGWQFTLKKIVNG